MQRVLLALLRTYQLTLSPLIGRQCRFYPSCSHYAMEAIRVHGCVKGTGLAGRRLVRCHPFNPGGVDLVPASEHRHPGHQGKAQFRADPVGPS